MFFKRSENASHTNNPAAGRPSVAPIDAPNHTPLPAQQLRRSVNPDSLGFSSTSELQPITGLIGQDRALKAIEFGASMNSHDFNVFVLGPTAAGKTTAVKAFLKKKNQEPSPVYDWVYVNNFDDFNRPSAIRMPCGRAQAFAKRMVEVIDELRQTVPTAFESEDYQAQRRQIDDGFRAGQEEAFEALNQKAQAQNIAILKTPNGIAMAPMHDGKVVKPEVFSGLPEEMRRSVEEKIAVLQTELESILETVPKSDKERREKLADLNGEFAESAVREALKDLRAEYTDIPEVTAYLEAAGHDLIRNVASFLPQPEEVEQVVRQPVDVSRDPRFRRYMVNVVVANGSPDVCERPIVEELNPTYGNIVGRIEHIAQMGAIVTDFSLIKPGAMHRANGGYLLIDARKLLLSPFAWEALKRALKSQEIKIEAPAETTAGIMSTQTLDPEPIPLNVKVILFGDRQLYYMLAANDPDFDRLFKVQADFDDTIARNDENHEAYARLITSIVVKHELRHASVGAVARLIAEGSRLADDRDKLSIEIGRLADIVREADFRAGEAGRAEITEEDVERAIDERIQRSDRMRDRAQESITREVVLIDTEGKKIGQINGLSVLQLGNFAFGRPTRITARAHMGQGRVTDIEREVKLGGPLHSKGVMILWGFLAGRFAQRQRLAMAASLVFEQSYGGVDGDSASSTELYALLSALSEVPIDQGLAVTGSVNQWGEVQAIGGVNEKIEGFFDICQERGLTGNQGVLIPEANVQHMMLRPDIVEACEKGRFRVHSVGHIDQGIEILTGVKAGAPDDDGNYTPGTIYRMVQDKLADFAYYAKQMPDAEQDNDPVSS